MSHQRTLVPQERPSGEPVFSAISGAKLRVGFDFRGRKYLYHVRIPSRADQIHEVDFNLDVLRYFDIPVQTRYPQILPDSTSITNAKDIFLKLNFGDSPVIALNPAASWPAKKWPAKHFVDLAYLLSNEYNTKFLIYFSYQLSWLL